MHDDLVRIHARDECGRELATRAHAKTCSLLRDPPCDGCGQERLSCINQASLRERRAVAPNPMTKVVLVDDVGRGAEFIGDFGQRHLTDTKPTQLIDVSGQRPYRPVYSGRGGVPQRRQDLEESHRTGFSLPQLLPNNAIQSLGTLNAGVDVATDNTLQSPCVRQHRRAPPLVGRLSCPKANAGAVFTTATNRVQTRTR